MVKKIKNIIDFFDVESSYVTEFRRLLHKIKNHDKETEIKSILMTSAMLSEGKSTICSFLGLTSSRLKGLKTLILDSDLRRPSIDKFFNITNHPGLMEILVDGYNPKDAICKTGIDKLDILTSGRRCFNPSEVFDADAIGNIVDEMKFYYDLILIDSPPLLPVSDPMMLIPKVDGVLLVIKAGATQKEVVQRAVDIVSADKNKIIGVVLNNLTHSLPYYYDYNYYHYDYQQKPTKKKTSRIDKKKDSSNYNSKVSSPKSIKNNITPDRK